MFVILSRGVFIVTMSIHVDLLIIDNAQRDSILRLGRRVVCGCRNFLPVAHGPVVYRRG